ncbi:MAG: peptidoglycan-binding protein [Nitrospirae bacterium]|nr:peptidoglycan-binding protein [Nitrospirota bacterium]
MPIKELVFNGPVKRDDRGAKVAQVQEWLCLNGYQVKIDKDFGPATELAVRRFQKSNRLPETGTVDEPCFNALTTPMRRALAPLNGAGKTFGGLVVNYAKQHLAEHPLEIGGQNSGPWVRLYMGGNQGPDWPWCAGFVCYILKQAAGTSGVPLPFKPTYGCDSIASQTQQSGIFVSEKSLASGNVPKSAMKPGSIFLNRNSKNSSDWTHTGIVTAFREDSFDTIEGNTNDAGDREGYEVCKRIRGYKNTDFVKVS